MKNTAFYSESDYENAVTVIEELMMKGRDRAPEETTLLNLMKIIINLFR